LHRYSEVLGLPVICTGGWQKPWNNKRYNFCPKEKSVVAFLIECKGYNRRKKVVFASDVLSLGRDALIVNDADDVRDLKKVLHRPEFKDKGDILDFPYTQKMGKTWERQRTYCLT